MRILPLLPLALIVISGCNRQENTPSADNNPPPAATPTAVVPGDAAEGVSMRYRCDGGSSVEILTSGSARVTLADGRVVELPAVSGSAPPAYAGEALSFAIGSDGGQLAQDEGGQQDCSVQ